MTTATENPTVEELTEALGYLVAESRKVEAQIAGARDARVASVYRARWDGLAVRIGDMVERVRGAT